MMPLVVFVIGTRPEAIKMAPVIHALRERGAKTVICSTGQHREMLRMAFDDFSLRADYELDVMSADQNLGKLTANLTDKLHALLGRVRPDWVLVQGDTTSVLAGSLCAFYHKIKVGHVEAGLRSFDRYSPFPEEINRKLAACLATAHFAPTVRAHGNLLAEGVAPQSVHLTGNTIVDAVNFMSERLAGDAEALPDPLADWQRHKRIVLVTCHRRESFGEPLRDICRALRHIAQKYPDIGLVFPVHMNPHVQETVYSRLRDTANVLLLPPVSYRSLLSLLRISYLVLSDSGGIQEEAPSFRVPLLVLRDTTERPEGIEAGCAKLVGANGDAIIAAASLLLDDPEAHAAMRRAENPYGDGLAGKRIAEILLEA